MAKITFTKEDKINSIKTPLILFAICFVSVALLAVINKVTVGPIAENEEKAAYAAMETVLPAAAYVPVTAPEIQGDCTVSRVCAALDENGEVMGYCISIGKIGYKNFISAMVAVSMDASTLFGVDIVSQNETPGLGSKILKEEFLNQFFDVATPITGNVDTISGATVSSSTVVSIVDTAVACVADHAQSWEKEVASK